MQLTVVAADRPDVATPTDGYIVRLVGEACPGDRVPPGLRQITDTARLRLQAIFPEWLWGWVRRSGVLQLRQYEGPVSWWWYTPLSEMSPMRSPLISELYWLILLQLLLEQLHVDRIAWHGNDPELAAVAGRVASRAGVAFDASTSPLSWSRRLWVSVARRLKFSVTHACLCVALRALGFAQLIPKRADVVLYSRFPVLWEAAADAWRERMFGEWPSLLERRGLSTAYLAVCSGSIGQVVTDGHRWLNRCARQTIVILEAILSPSDFIRAHLDLRLAVGYLRWRLAQRSASVLFDGLDVSRLLWREIDANALSPEIPQDVALASAVRCALLRMSGVKTVCLPFEYQPMERAVWAGAQHPRPRAVVGLQTGAYTAIQMGFTFPATQVRTDRADAQQAPLPDALVAYGELPYRLFAERLGSERVCQAGPIRYPQLARPIEFDRTAFCARFDLPLRTTHVLVTTSTVRSESLLLLDAAFRSAAQLANVFLLVKFHYHLPLHDEVTRLACHYGISGYRVFDANLDELLTLAAAIVCGGSSTGLEAIARGCMPLVLERPADLMANPMLEVPEAVFFWDTAAELASALASTVAHGEAYERRRAKWMGALRTHLWPLDGHADERLFDYLRGRNLIAPSLASATQTHSSTPIATVAAR